MLKCPERIKLNGRWWSVRTSTPVEQFYMYENMIAGLTIPEEQLIVIDPSLKKEYADEVLIHELMHAAMPIGKSRLKVASHSQEEKLITAIAPGLAQAINQLKIIGKKK